MSSKIDPQLFSHHEHALGQELCPECQAPMQLKQGKRGPFLGCSNYPECHYIHSLNQNDGHIVKALGVPCPQCQHELVLRQGRYGMFIGCSHYPDCHHIESLGGDKPQTQAPLVACPECGRGHLTERQSRYGKTFYACDCFPKCKFAINHPPLKGRCELCGFTLLMEKKRGTEVDVQCAERKCHHIQTKNGA